MLERVRAYLLRLLLDPPAADLPAAILPVPDVPAPEAVVRFAAADGAALRGLWVEATAPPRGAVVFAPAFEETAVAWRRHAGFLPAAGWAVLALDFRGHGASPVEAGYTPRKWATDREVRDVVAAVAEARRRAGGGPVHLVGVSRGAAAAAAAALEAPVASVIADSLVSTAAACRERAPRFAAIHIGRAARLLGPAWGPVVAWTLREAERREGIRFVRIEEVLPRLGRPVLLIWGDRDDLAGGHRDALAALAPRSDVWIVRGARHNAAAVAAPDEYRRRILSFLDTIPR